MENLILQFLNTAPGRAFSLKEISKKVDRRLYRVDPYWARPHLSRLITQGQVAKNEAGNYLCSASEYASWELAGI